MKTDDGKGTQIGDLIMWITVNGTFAWGKVTNFNCYGRPIAKRIIGFSHPKYKRAHEVSSQYFIVRKKDYSADTVTEEHILSKAVRQYLELERQA